MRELVGGAKFPQELFFYSVLVTVFFVGSLCLELNHVAVGEGYCRSRFYSQKLPNSDLNTSNICSPGKIPLGGMRNIAEPLAVRELVGEAKFPQELFSTPSL